MLQVSARFGAAACLIITDLLAQPATAADLPAPNEVETPAEIFDRFTVVLAGSRDDEVKPVRLVHRIAEK